ncbi:MAG: ribosome biogenesis GTP-binding protein YihA/YsxC [Lachnospiraceae bacterium]|nr:ribosome biogenesis GTP-binding protein YihA/YsxC [Lachnospiraceae bacterium]
MIVKNATLETVCGITSKLPENACPEIAFAGKSNVGKSSLINVLMNRKNLARTSSQPGKTQTINFYKVNAAPEDLYFVDLPGYGYASASKEQRAKWGPMIEKYLKRSKQLKAVFLLIDIRHEPGANDVQMYEWVLANGYQPIIIATKSDKISKGQIQKQTALIRKKLTSGEGKGTSPLILPFSALTKAGREEIYALIEELLEVGIGDGP